MWQIDNATPFSAERCGTRDRDGAEVWLVGVKAGFDLGDDGVPQISRVQQPVSLAPEFHGDPAFSSLANEADLVWARSGTDVYITGSAHSPEGPVTNLGFGFCVGPVRRVAEAIGDRTWEGGALGGLRPSAPGRFVSMPLRWEHAFGGTDHTTDPPAWDQRNPVGRGFAIDRENLEGTLLPNIEDPSALITSAGARPAPVGFGPIARHWHPRAQYGGTYDKTWFNNRRPLLPDDFDVRYQRAAPIEQQVDGFLSGGEEFRLVNMHPRIPNYASFLPVVELTFRTHFRNRGRITHGGHLISITLDADQARLAMVWVSELPCHHDIQRLLTTEVRLASRVRVRPGLVNRRA